MVNPLAVLMPCGASQSREMRTHDWLAELYLANRYLGERSGKPGQP